MSELVPTPSPGQPVPAPRDPNVVMGWLKDIFRQVRLAWELFFDPRVPWMTKLIPPLTIAYILSPIDILPDMALGLGQLDDLAILLLGFKLFIDLSPTEIVLEHLRKLGARIGEMIAEEQPTVIDGEFSVEQETDPGPQTTDHEP